MEAYKDVSGDSGITGYTIGEESITVRFAHGGTYRYTYDSAGKSNIELMKVLARTGQRLNTFINAHVRDKFERKLHH